MAALESSRGPDDAVTLSAKNNLGLVLARRTRFDEAEKLLLEVVNARLRLHGEMNRGTLTSMANLGLVYYNSGRPQLAEEWFRRELRGAEKILPADHPDLLISLNNWARFAARVGPWRRACPA